MKSNLLALAVVPALLFVGAAPVAASPASDGFVAACGSNPDFFSFAVEGLASNTVAHGRLCGCLVTTFESASEADLVMLTKDIDGTATVEDRTAYGDYTALELRARDALDVCLVEAGLASPSADMTKFDLACASSDLLLNVLGGTPAEATPKRTALCACLTDTLAPQITTADADILAMDLDGTATGDSRDAHAGYKDLSDRAGDVFEQCSADL